MTEAPKNARAKYIGPVPSLKGLLADITVYPQTGRCLARFDDTGSGFGLGTHDFNAEHFEILPDDAQ
ncbi:hypothetical protein JessAGP_012 [Caulobacter phage Jess A]|nr:hypothetical protein JessAGP_012 [Caulobacter phage Jess A]QNH91665.1 hypothetical protein SR18_gp014 [Caulobacter phage SR18]WCA46421.1 hypothetical protein [Caulobacter phage RapA]WCD56198.1 hypothetical protein [Caulobacter phage BL94]